jgi:pectinesterase
VVLTYDLHANSVIAPATQPVGTTGSTSIAIASDDFTAENVTFENPSGNIAQAVAVKTTGDRIVFRNCRFLGGQDTLYPNGKRTYFDRCYIEGRADFIFGRATAVFDHCTIHSKNGGYVTAPSTLPENPYGFVFLDCKLTGDGDKAYLGRPWRDYGSSVFIRCDLGAHIRPEGFHNWRVERENTARFAEYKNTGPGADRSKRVAWSKELTDDEAAKYTLNSILGGEDNWDPSIK